jgi:CrcB protein
MRGTPRAGRSCPLPGVLVVDLPMPFTLSLNSFLAVGAGAACGAWLRWGLGVLLNGLFPLLPFGTLAANLLGGLLMGAVLGALQAWPTLSPALKLLLTTGFLGGLTTFSTFSAEAFHLVQRGAWGWLAAHLLAHVAGALLMTWAGYTLFNALRG